MKNLIENLVVTLQSRFTYVNVIEILIIAFVIYKILMWIRGTQAEQVAKGIIIVLVLIPLSSWLGLTTLNYLLNNIITWAVIVVAVVFQPELRSALEQLGNNRLFERMFRSSGEKKMLDAIEDIRDAVADMAEAHIGALIVCGVNTGLKDIEGTGIALNADISTELIENIFTPNRPLHDGAMIVNLWNGKIRTAGCLLPLTDRRTLNSSLGTRHRAGIGISEQSDAIVIIVSEETGTISVAHRGVLRRDFTPEDIATLLADRFIDDEDEEEETIGADNENEESKMPEKE
ncbi:TIGR00159 family protein [Pseudoramibacter alactolyticus ATCC 23263]|jgi:diadenylate cyclase|uniref:Diadenylate cyclase n=1 Tax=Pseudoramibacter alactolyticus ATCC 23263 TaxID=887929 RepID=E6ME80_9FIRM|nr:diadenylate cyclase CdaA [Pseudoramibacter alactolyticus]EFV02627.1 TIGR00159 family protein [Pseudoramibacter alactolyticus ATCC 23263]